MKQTVEQYLAALEAGDTPAILALFSDDAWVLSPFLGRMSARDFFPRLAESSRASKLTVHDILLSAQGKRRAVGYFRYDWQLRDGSWVNFECADVFNFAAREDKIESLVILYDTHPIRASVGDKYA